MNQSASPAPERLRLHWIETLRGIAVLGVLAQHMLFERVAPSLHSLKPYLDLGLFGVVVFFCISGFIIPYSVLGLQQQAGLHFPVARLFRLFPTYWLSLGLAALVFHPGLQALLVNTTMAQRFVGQPDVLGVYWTLQVELIFYAIFELLILTHRVSSNRLYPVLSLGFALLAIVFAAGRFYLSRKLPLAPPAGLAVMFASTTYFLHLTQGYLSRLRLVLFSLAVFALLCIAFGFGYSRNWGFHETPQRFIAMYLLAALVFVAFQRFAFNSRLLGLLGKVSYSVYLFHVPLIALVGAVLLRRFGLVEATLLELALIFAVATTVFWLVEKRFVQLGRALLSSRVHPPTAPPPR